MTKEREALTLAQEVIQMLGAPSPLHFSKEEIIKWQECNTAIKEALAQPEQEPVAWITQGGKGWLRWHKPEDNNTDSVPLYTTPPQRTWVGLTDEEIQKMRHLIDWTANWSYGTFARAIEAKLKEKNT